ncbi:unnamed protein product [Pseudo-nitzschia multistriata]|uniref:Uncharacterized protein n=1 Tax=Pseudo-nitzschia multistriata TaxID=183589 RepID=A0A448YVG9_9STRA|nr:unnamed protein product [Pseudo-nitzschia multistriata]
MSATRNARRSSRGGSFPGERTGGTGRETAGLFPAKNAGTPTTTTNTNTNTKPTASGAGRTRTKPKQKQKTKTSRNLTDPERKALLRELLRRRGANGRPARGALKAAAAAFGTSTRTCSRIWASGGASRRHRCGRKARPEGDLSCLVASVPLEARGNLRALAEETGIPKASLHRYVRKGVLEHPTHLFRPLLGDDHRKERIAFCLSHLGGDGNLNGNGACAFGPMKEVVHLAEKWFFRDEAAANAYFLPAELEPGHNDSNNDKNDSNNNNNNNAGPERVLFLCATARPRHDASRNAWFDGKLGIWPLVVPGEGPCGPGEKASRYRKIVAEKLLPAVYERFPRDAFGSSSDESKTNSSNSNHHENHHKDGPFRCVLQEDRSLPHSECLDREALVEAARKHHWEISFAAQPNGSADFSVPHLGFFRSVQSLQHKQQLKQQQPKQPEHTEEPPETPTERASETLIQAVQRAFCETGDGALATSFRALWFNMEDALGVGGDNSYRPRHPGKPKSRATFGDTGPVPCDPVKAGYARLLLANSHTATSRRNALGAVAAVGAPLVRAGSR